MHFSKIYKLAPQMQIYNKLRFNWKPFVMFMQESKFRSEIVNTDDFGLRFNNQKITKLIFDRENEQDKKSGAIIGSSAVFGVGCSKDSLTIPSLLSENTEYNYFNLGVKAYAGFQEIILFNSLINKLKKIEEVIIFSGVNDLFMNRYINNYNKILGPMFYTNQFNDSMEIGLKQLLLNRFYDLFSKSKPGFIDLKNNLNQNIFEIVKRNLYFWANIKNGMNIKLYFFLQPFANWCEKELSKEEIAIFDEYDKNKDIRPNQILKTMNLDIYNEYRFFLNETCKELNIDFFDCNEHLSSEEYNNKWLFVDRIHLTDLGNKVMSQFIKSKI